MKTIFEFFTYETVQDGYVIYDLNGNKIEAYDLVVLLNSLDDETKINTTSKPISGQQGHLEVQLPEAVQAYDPANQMLYLYMLKIARELWQQISR